MKAIKRTLCLKCDKRTPPVRRVVSVEERDGKTVRHLDCGHEQRISGSVSF